MDPHFEQTLAGITMAPYIVKATALIGVRRKTGSNMFRHQMSTMTILLDYKILDSVLLKASVIHDLFENAAAMPGVSEAEIAGLDSDGPAVVELVKEVTIRIVAGVREPKPEYLQRVMRTGSDRARRLKLADRIANLTELGFVHDSDFVRRSLDETRRYVLPYAAAVNVDMARELTDLLKSREDLLPHESGAGGRP